MIILTFPQLVRPPQGKEPQDWLWTQEPGMGGSLAAAQAAGTCNGREGRRGTLSGLGRSYRCTLHASHRVLGTT